MSSLEHTPGRPQDPVGRALFGVSRVFALCGGIVLCAMALLTTVSVIGRAFLNSPVTGDFELIAVGTGVSVFAFLPYCQLTGANVVVDFFMSAAPVRVRSALDLVGSLMFGMIMAILTWRTTLGGQDMYNAAETTMVLEVPRWWTFPFAVASLALLVVVCAYTLVNSLKEVRLGRSL